MAVASVKDVVADVATDLGISKSEAENITKSVLKAIVGRVKEGGFCYKGQFTINKKEKSAREGSIMRKDPISGEKTKIPYSSPAYTSIGITLGKDLKAEMNPNL